VLGAGGCCWSAAGQGNIQDGQATAGTGRAALWGWLSFAWLLRISGAGLRGYPDL